MTMVKNCCVCAKEKCLYKCPVCTEPYCSVTCCKKHKENNCKPPSLIQNTDVNINSNDNRIKNYEYPTEDTVPLAKLAELRDNEDLKECLKNPHVRKMMLAILNSKNPTEAIASAMTEPIFVEMADACLKIIEPKDDDELS